MGVYLRLRGKSSLPFFVAWPFSLVIMIDPSVEFVGPKMLRFGRLRKVVALF